MEIFEKIPE